MSSQIDCLILKPSIFQVSLSMTGFLLCFWMTWESPLKFSLHMGWERKLLVIKLILLLWRDNLLLLCFGLVDLVWGGFAVFQRFFSGDMDSCKRNWSLLLTSVNPMARGWKWLILVSFLEVNFLILWQLTRRMRLKKLIKQDHTICGAYISSVYPAKI